MSKTKKYVPPKDDAERAERHARMVAAGIKNLKPCKPGETHNPNGRPKRELPIASKMIKYGQLIAPDAMTAPLYDALPELLGQKLTIDDCIWINANLAAAANSIANMELLIRKQEGDSVNINFNDLTPQRRVDPSKLTYDTKKLIRQAVQAAKVRPEGLKP